MTPATLRQVLAGQLAAVRAALGTAGRPEPDGRGDEGDRALGTTTHELATWSRERLLKRQAALLAALAAMDGGRYGRCEDCRAAIPPARLRALPWALRCVGCQAEAERRAAADDEPEVGVRRTPRPARMVEEGA